MAAFQPFKNLVHLRLSAVSHAEENISIKRWEILE
jgi:hypothetical protein